MEILMRGGCVMAPKGGYASRLILDEVNGLLLPDDDDAWIAAIKVLATNPQRRVSYGEAAELMAASLHMSQVAPRYMSPFKTLLTEHLAQVLCRFDKRIAIVLTHLASVFASLSA